MKDFKVAKVLIPAIPRSGSTLLLDMITVPTTKRAKVLQPLAGSGDMAKFSIFEPCHDGDVVDGKPLRNEPEESTCVGLIQGIASCDFSKISALWGWNDTHTRWNGAAMNSSVSDEYESKATAAACRSSNLVAMKTVTAQFYESKNSVEDRLIPLLNAVPSLRVVMNVRDPRGIYASWKRVFKDRDWTFNKSKMTEFCEYYAGFTRANHTRLKVVRFEDMVENPRGTIKDIYRFLGFFFGKPQGDWINEHFHAARANYKSCEDGPRNYTTCRSAPRAAASSWIRELPRREKNFFLEQPVCRTVAKFFGYDAKPNSRGAAVRVAEELPKKSPLNDPDVQAALSNPAVQEAIRSSMKNRVYGKRQKHAPEDIIRAALGQVGERRRRDGGGEVPPDLHIAED